MKKVLIALSAAFATVPANFNLLTSCERIYTTQAGRYDELIDLFGDRVQIVPDQCHDTLAFIRDREMSRHPGCHVEFLHYECLANNSRRFDESLEKQKAELEAKYTALVERLQDELEVALQDVRRLNYLVKLAEYHPKTDDNPEPYTTWGITARPGQTLQEVLDRMMHGLVFDVTNQPLSTPLGTIMEQTPASADPLDGHHGQRDYTDCPVAEAIVQVIARQPGVGEIELPAPRKQSFPHPDDVRAASS